MIKGISSGNIDYFNARLNGQEDSEFLRLCTIGLEEDSSGMEYKIGVNEVTTTEEGEENPITVEYSLRVLGLRQCFNLLAEPIDFEKKRVEEFRNKMGFTDPKSEESKLTTAHHEREIAKLESLVNGGTIGKIADTLGTKFKGIEFKWQERYKELQRYVELDAAEEAFQEPERYNQLDIFTDVRIPTFTFRTILNRDELEKKSAEVVEKFREIVAELDSMYNLTVDTMNAGNVKMTEEKYERVEAISTIATPIQKKVSAGNNAVTLLSNEIEARLNRALDDFNFSKVVDRKKVVNAYLNHLTQRGDPLGLMLCEFDHMVEAMYTAKSLMDQGPAYFSEHRDAIGLAALFHDIYAVTRKPGIEIGDPLSLANYLKRNIGHAQEKEWNKPIIDEVALAAIGQRDGLYDLIVTAVDFSSGKHKMSAEDWEATQWVTPMRIADNMATQRSMGDRHMHLVYNWAVDAYQGVEAAEKIAKRIGKRQGFCQTLADGKIKELLQDQILERKKINMAEEFPGLVDKIEQVGGLAPIRLNPITAYTTAVQIRYNADLNQMFLAFREAGYDRTAYTLKK